MAIKIQSDYNMNSHKVTNLANAVSSGDATNLAQVQALIDASQAGLIIRGLVTASFVVPLPTCTYANGTAGVGATLTGDVNGALPDADGIALSAGDYVLVPEQSAALQNGAYIITQLGSSILPFILTRATWMNTAAELDIGSAVWVLQGDTSAGAWIAVSTAPTTVGTDPIVFTGVSSVVAGPGLEQTGNIISAKSDITTGGNQVPVTVTSDGLSVDKTLIASGATYTEDIITGDWVSGVLTILGVDHALGVNSIMGVFLDNTGAQVFLDYSVDPSTFDVTFTDSAGLYSSAGVVRLEA